MIDFKDNEPMTVWAVITQQGGETKSWPLCMTEAEGLGRASRAIFETLKDDFTMNLMDIGEGWLMTGTPTTDGYPKRYTVMAYVLPTLTEEARTV